MQPRESESGAPQEELFCNRLDQILSRRHPLFILANEIKWSIFDEGFGPLFEQRRGRPALPTRLIVGLHYLKHAFNESDESVVERLLENPYWQYFCGFEFFQHHFPLDRSSMTNWRKRLGPNGLEKLLKETLEAAKKRKLVTAVELKKVNVDTTVQEKAISFPTDARLYFKARRALVRIARKNGIELRQTYERVGKKSLARQGRYAHAKQMKRARKETKRLRTFLGRVIRDIKRKTENPDTRLKNLLELSERIYNQKREDTNKVYSVHAPEVECISKGKAHKRYEFGCKVAIATTSKNNWVVGSEALHGSPYDGHTLKGTLDQVKRLTGAVPEDVFVDRGYRGKQPPEISSQVHLCGARKKLTRSERKWEKRRAAIEPKIGHMKYDNRMDRNFLLGKTGDQMNAILAGCGANMRKLLWSIYLSIFYFIFGRCKSISRTQHQSRRLQSNSGAGVLMPIPG